MMQKVKNVIKFVLFNIITIIAGDKNKRVNVKILKGPNRGLRFKLDLVRRQESSYLFGNYDITILEILNKVEMDGWVVWDCGTYLGYYTNFFAKKVGNKGRVVAIEPDTKNLKRTEKNLMLNDFKNYSVQNLAVGGPLGKSDFVISDSTNSHIQGVYVGGSEIEYKESIEHIDQITKVNIVSIDQLLENEEIPKPDLIKIDIEGAEKEALKYTNKLKNDFRPIILLELHNPECDESAWEFSVDKKYSIYSVPKLKKLVRKEDVFGNLLCVPPEKESFLTEILYQN